MNKRWVLGLVAATTLGACNRTSQVTVLAVSSGDGDAVAHAQLTVRLLPYDRDAVFADMIAAAERSEPEPPADLLEIRDSIAVAQDRWRDAEAAWNNTYSELRSLSERMERMNQSSNEYFAAYGRFDNLDGQERRLRREKDRYFEQFTELQGQYTARADSFNAVLTTWEDVVFEGFGEVIDSLLEASGREEIWDTTDGGGAAQFAVPKGRWWIHTRAELPFEELYWNVPIDVTGGTTDTITIDKSNAESRLVF